MNNSSASATQKPIAVASDKYDVIACRQYENLCLNGAMVPCTVQSTCVSRYPTKYEYAAQQGYRWIHKISVTVSGSTVFLMLEVSK